MATSPQKKFRVLVVDDSAFMCKVLETIFNADEHLQVVGKARDGREAIALAETLKPDVITMDLNMPHLDGLQATAHIMTSNPRPIVVVSSETREGAASTLKALELGAIEFVTKPSGGIDLDMQSVKEDLLRKVRSRGAHGIAHGQWGAVVGRKAAASKPYASANNSCYQLFERYALSCCGARRVHGRTSNGDAHGAGIHTRFSSGGFSGAAYAVILHQSVRAAIG